MNISFVLLAPPASPRARPLNPVRAVRYPMELGTRDTLLTVATSVLMLAGIAMVLFLRDSVMTMVGIVLVTLAAIVFIVDAKDLIVKTDQNARD